MARRRIVKKNIIFDNEEIYKLKNKYKNLIKPEDLIRLYMLGIFPMSNDREDKTVFLVDPEIRTIIPIKQFHFSKSLKRSIKRRPFKITLNKAFPQVIKACATIDRDQTWISNEIESLFISLHKMQYAHSIECWKDDKLVGGVYGLAIGGVFFAESMFSAVSNGSKIALSNLVAILYKTGFKLLDVQFLNEHLLQFGAYEITKHLFKIKLKLALSIKADIYSTGSTDNDLFECLSSLVHANIDKS